MPTDVSLHGEWVKVDIVRVCAMPLTSEELVNVALAGVIMGASTAFGALAVCYLFNGRSRRGV